MTGLHPDDVLTAAVQATGLDDFGGSSFQEGLAVLCDSVNSEARLNDLGQLAVRQNIVGGLANRLRVVDWVRRHPDIGDERIEAPLVVVGMFRAGTTFLSQLLEQDAQSRALLRWEAAASVPPPTQEDFRSGRRVEAERAAIDMLESLNPRIKVVHHEDPAGPTECLTVLGQDFKSLVWEAMANIPTYSRWLLGADLRSSYDYHQTVLQVLQSGGVRGGWTLKSPHHALALDTLAAVYPDAQLVVLHRDPVVLCASACSLITTLTSTFTDHDHRPYIAEHWTTMLEESVARIEAFRAAGPATAMVDVQYADLVSDPLNTVEAIYAACGRDLEPAAATAIATHVAANPKGRFGVHGYRFEDFGLDADVLAERFSDYTQRYDIPAERANVD